MKRMDSIIYDIWTEADTMADALAIAGDAIAKEKETPAEGTSSQAEEPNTSPSETSEVTPEETPEAPDETEELITKLFASASFTQNLGKVLSEDRTFLKKVFKKIKIGVQK